MMTDGTAESPRATWRREGESLILELAGEWRRGGPAVAVTGTPPDRCADRYEAEALGAFDSTLPAFLLAHLRTHASKT